jgi:hypothetical protein
MSILGDIGKAIKSAIDSVGHAVSDAASAVAHAFGDAAKAVADFVTDPQKLLDGLKAVAKLLGDSELGFLLGGLAGETLLQIADLFGLSTVEQLATFLSKLKDVPRRLTPVEAGVVDLVFNTNSETKTLLPVPTVPANKIRVTPLSTPFTGQPFTVPAALLADPNWLLLLGGLGVAAEVAQTLYWTAAAAGLVSSDIFLMNVGLSAWKGGIDSVTLVHESTHVWQGVHWSGAPFSYVSEAISDRNYDYGYDPSRQWNSYGAEQQAKIVEEWFAGGACRPASPAGLIPPGFIPGKGCVPPVIKPGMAPPPTGWPIMFSRNPAFRFIKKNLWTGNNDAFSDESALPAVGTSLHPLVNYGGGSSYPGWHPSSASAVAPAFGPTPAFGPGPRHGSKYVLK